MTQTLLSADAIRAARRRTEDVEVPEWPNEDGTPGTIRMSEMSAARTLLMHDLVKERPDDGMFIIVVFSAVRDDGSPVFEQPYRDADGNWQGLGDVEMLKEKGLPVMNRLQRVALRLNRAPVPNVSGEAQTGASPTN